MLQTDVLVCVASLCIGRMNLGSTTVTARHAQGKLLFFMGDSVTHFYALENDPANFEINKRFKREPKPIVEVLFLKRKRGMKFILQVWALKGA